MASVSASWGSTFRPPANLIKQTGGYMVEIGRVVLVTRGPDTGKICAIVDVVDQNRVLVDGPSSGVKRQALSFTEIALTKFRIQIPHGTGSRFVKKVWDGDEVEKKFSETRKAKQLEAAKRRSEMTDFDRFKLYKTKQRVNRSVAAVFRKLKTKARKERPKRKIVAAKPKKDLNKKKKVKRLAKKAQKA